MTLVAVLLTAAIWLGLVGSTVVGPGALSWREIARRGRRRAPGRIAADLAVGAAAAIPVILVTASSGRSSSAIFGTAPEPPIRVPPDGGGLVLSLIAAASRRADQRGAVLPRLRDDRLGAPFGPRRAIVRGALFFAFVHVLTLCDLDFGRPPGRRSSRSLARLPVALALGWLFLRRGSLPASIGLHATFNGHRAARLLGELGR